MNIQRLKFAQARGARIQVLDTTKRWCWIFARFDAVGATYRIHPDDEHLQYGPISAQMLEWAQAEVFTTVAPTSSAEWHAARHYWLAARFATDSDQDSLTEDECRMLALFLAEMLADEGL